MRTSVDPWNLSLGEKVDQPSVCRRPSKSGGDPGYRLHDDVIRRHQPGGLMENHSTFEQGTLSRCINECVRPFLFTLSIHVAAIQRGTCGLSRDEDVDAVSDWRDDELAAPTAMTGSPPGNGSAPHAGTPNQEGMEALSFLRT